MRFYPRTKSPVGEALELRFQIKVLVCVSQQSSENGLLLAFFRRKYTLKAGLGNGLQLFPKVLIGLYPLENSVLLPTWDMSHSSLSFVPHRKAPGSVLVAFCAFAVGLPACICHFHQASEDKRLVMNNLGRR